jgi:hypothetical protein
LSFQEGRIAAAGKVNADARHKHKGRDREDRGLRKFGIGVQQDKIALHEPHATLHNHNRAENKKGHHHYGCKFRRHETSPTIREVRRKPGFAVRADGQFISRKTAKRCGLDASINRQAAKICDFVLMLREFNEEKSM